MRVNRFIEYLKTLPENMEIYVQTCEGDLLSPLEMNNLWVTESFVAERYGNLEQSKLCITAFIKGRDAYKYENDRRGFEVKYIDEIEKKSEEQPK
jgi:hypothetical protein